MSALGGGGVGAMVSFGILGADSALIYVLLGGVPLELGAGQGVVICH